MTVLPHLDHQVSCVQFTAATGLLQEACPWRIYTFSVEEEKDNDPGRTDAGAPKSTGRIRRRVAGKTDTATKTRRPSSTSRTRF